MAWVDPLSKSKPKPKPGSQDWRLTPRPQHCPLHKDRPWPSEQMDSLVVECSLLGKPECVCVCFRGMGCGCGSL